MYIIKSNINTYFRAAVSCFPAAATLPPSSPPSPPGSLSLRNQSFQLSLSLRNPKLETYPTHRVCVCRDGRRGFKASELHLRGHSQEEEEHRSMGFKEKRTVPAKEIPIHQEAGGFHPRVSQQGN